MQQMVPACKGGQHARAEVLSWHGLAGEDALHCAQAQRGFLIRRQRLQLHLGGRLPLDYGLRGRPGCPARGRSPLGWSSLQAPMQSARCALPILCLAGGSGCGQPAGLKTSLSAAEPTEASRRTAYVALSRSPSRMSFQHGLDSRLGTQESTQFKLALGLAALSDTA